MAKGQEHNPEFKEDRVLAVLSPDNVLKLPFFKEQLARVFPGVDLVGPKDLDHLHGVVHRSRHTHRLVLVVGGDGTLHQVLQRFDITTQVLGVLPAGTGNDFARVVGYRGGLKERVGKLAKLRPRPTDFGVLNGRRFINSGGFGIDSHVLNTMRQGKGFIARNYNAAFVKTLFSLKPMAGVVTRGGGEVSDRFFWVLAMNTPCIGGGTRIAPRAVLDDGHLDLLLVKETSRLNLLRFFPAALKGRHLDLPVVDYTKVTEATVRLEQPLDYFAVDGELVFCGKREVTLKAGAGQLMFLR